MPLQEQVVAFPLVGGLDEASHPRLCARLLTMHNCRQFKDGSIGKRYGTVPAFTANARLGGLGAPPAGELLTCRGDELVRVGAGQVDSVKTIGSTDCIYKGRASEALVYRRQFSNGETVVGAADVAYANGYTVIANAGYRRSVAGTVATTRISATVVDGNGATVLVNALVDSGLTTDIVGSPHVLSIGTTAFFVWVHGTNVKARTLDLTTMTWGAITTLVGSLTLQSVAACVIGSTIVIAYQLVTGVYTASFTTALAVSHAAVQASASTALGPFALEGLSGASLYLGYATSGGGFLTIKGVVLNPSTLAVTTAEFTVSTSVDTYSMANIGILPDSTATNAIYAWSQVKFSGSTIDDAFIAWLSSSSTGTLTTVNNSRSLSLASKPWRSGSHLYALVRAVHSTHSTLFIAGLYEAATSPPVALGARLVATIAPRQAPKAQENLFDAVVSSVVATSTSRYAIGAIVSGGLPDSTTVSLLDVRMTATKPSAVQSGSLLNLSGGAPAVYDGSTVAELGFAFEPDAARMSTSVSAGGSLTASKTYYYLAVYEYRFANGAVVRSIPSYSAAYRTTADDGTALPLASRGMLSAVTTGVNKTVDIVLPFISLTSKQFRTTGFDEYPVDVVLYRTEGDGSVFYRLTSPQPQTEYQNNPLGTTTTVTDALDDATLRQRPQLYVTGGALPSEIPPSAGHVAVIQQRIWLSSTDDDTIWFSDVIVEGEAPAFSGSKTLAAFTGGVVIGMAALDEKFIVLKDKSLWFFTGDGPGIDGLGGTFSYPTLLSSTFGCTEVRSIVTTPLGVMFQSQNGLALIGRDLNVVLVGKAIEDTLAGRAIVTANVVPNQNLVRLTAGTDALELDLYHQNAWGSATYGASDIVGAVYCRDVWWFLTAAGAITREDTSLWTDNGVYVPSSLQLRYMALGDLQGFARVWFVSLDGEKRTDHDLTVTLHVDEEDSSTQTATWTSSESTGWSRLQAQVHVERQECEALSVEVADASPSDAGVVGTGEGFVLFGVSAEVGLEKPLRRVPTAQTK